MQSAYVPLAPGEGVIIVVGGFTSMLCTNCRYWAAAEPGGLCELCVESTAAAAAPPVLSAPTTPGPGKLKSPVGPARAAVVLFFAVVAADVLEMAADARMYFLAAGRPGGEFMDGSGVTRAADLQALTAALSVFLTLPLIVVFLVWFRRVRVNAEVFAPDAHRLSPGWAVGAWFVPLFSFWRPRRVALDTWTASAPLGPDGRRQDVPHGTVNAWWTAWVCAQLLSATGGDDAVGRTAGAVTASSGLEFCTAVADLVAALLAVVFVRRLTALQAGRVAQGPAAPLVPAPLAHPSPGGGVQRAVGGTPDGTP